MPWVRRLGRREPGLLMVAEHTEASMLFPSGKMTWKTRGAVAEQRRRFQFVKKLLTAPVLGTS